MYINYTAWMAQRMLTIAVLIRKSDAKYFTTVNAIIAGSNDVSNGGLIGTRLTGKGKAIPLQT